MTLQSIRDGLRLEVDLWQCLVKYKRPRKLKLATYKVVSAWVGASLKLTLVAPFIAVEGKSVAINDLENLGAITGDGEAPLVDPALSLLNSKVIS